MNKKKIVIFGVCLAVLLALQIKFIQPLLFDVAASDLFLVESKDEANPMSISTDMTALAYGQCNNYIKNDLGEEKSVSFTGQATNAWSLGNYEYIVNADVEISGKDSAGAIHHYVCRIQYTEGDDLNGVSNPDNWNVIGLTGIE